MSFFVESSRNKNVEWNRRKISLLGAAWSLIRQWRNGQDLTKVSMPAEFLNPYSALEISSFRNCVQFPTLVKINKENDPIQRMLQIVVWYLSGIKQEEFEKKPYNPILGETHHCSLDLGEHGECIYISEQVSHHPPVAAYFMGNDELKIYIEGSTEFGVKFNGNSISICNKGNIEIKLDHHEEVYLISKVVPDLQILNVLLGTKRFSWDGKVNVSCKKTGLFVNMQFQEDPKTKKSRVSGLLKQNKLQEPLYKFHGLIGDVLYKIDCSTSQQNQEVFFDYSLQNFPDIKYAEPNAQDEYESLKLWSKVSYHIVNNNMDDANREKILIEEAQRKRRKEGKDLEPRFFKFDSEAKKWVYDVYSRPQPIDEFSIPNSKLSTHIDNLKTNDGFEKEYTYIDEKSSRDSYFGDYGAASLFLNRPKNRYSNVLANEATRVKLEPILGEGSDYINANFISGLIPKSDKTYISTQGPLETTFSDFWRMVWEQNSCVIVMLTREVESGKLKCNKYWPSKGETKTCEPFEIILNEKDENVTPELTTRKFVLKHLQKDETREIYQFQYTAWPDHGLPPSIDAFLDLLHMAHDSNKTKGPFIVHCSAGIGRSGVFCTVHSMTEKFKYDLEHSPEEPRFNMVDTILRMRKQRSGIVQTKEQYEFCYLALSEEVKRILGSSKEEK